jgi:hypothetical protein
VKFFTAIVKPSEINSQDLCIIMVKEKRQKLSSGKLKITVSKYSKGHMTTTKLKNHKEYS